MTRWVEGELFGRATPVDRARWAKEERQWAATRNEGKKMSHKTTKWGVVERPPVTKDDDQQLDQFQELIDSALTTVKAVEARENALKAGTVDATRFPVMKGSQR